jgi:hypothetical protein
MKLKMTSKLWLSLLAALLCVSVAQTASAEDLIVVATQSTQKANANWQAFLQSKEIPFKLVTPQEFEKFKKAKYIVIMGSADEKDIVTILKEALLENDFNGISNKGSGKMYLRPSVWTPGQRVMIFVGSDQEAMMAARKASKDEWFEHLGDCFDIDTEGGLPSY